MAREAVILSIAPTGAVNLTLTLTYRGGLVGAVNALPLVWPVAAHDVEHPSNAGAE